MHVHEAIERLDQIHDQLTKSEVYRGFRVPAVAAVGALGLGAAILQPFTTGIGFVAYWIAVAGVCCALGMAAALRSYTYREDEFDRRRTRRVMAQFFPCLIAGGAVTAGLVAHTGLRGVSPRIVGHRLRTRRDRGAAASAPAIGWVGLGYIVAGALLLLRAPSILEPSPWTVGGVFGVGHLITALVLWCWTVPDVEDETDEWND